MHYKVTSQYMGARELPSEQFDDINQAKKFIEKKIQENMMLNVKVIYRLYEWDDLLHEFDPNKMATTTSSGETAGGGQGKGAGFRPTPLNTAPRPPGMPHSWVKDEDDKKDEKDKK